MVSVPLRGYGFEIKNDLPEYYKSTVFPSPYGDMVLKYPCRMTCLVYSLVSVPLRGYGFEIHTGGGRYGQLAEDVSVPLRGYGFEMSMAITYPEKVLKFPSPCGDMVLK